MSGVFGLSRDEGQCVSWHHITASTSREQRAEDADKIGKERGRTDGESQQGMKGQGGDIGLAG